MPSCLSGDWLSWAAVVREIKKQMGKRTDAAELRIMGAPTNKLPGLVVSMTDERQRRVRSPNRQLRSVRHASQATTLKACMPDTA